jgi:hypothetical protein
VISSIPGALCWQERPSLSMMARSPGGNTGMTGPSRCECSQATSSGYEWTTLRYESAELIGAGPADLALWFDEDQLTEVGEEEVDLLPGGRFAHRLLLWPEGEFGVAFRRLEIDHQPASSADRH